MKRSELVRTIAGVFAVFTTALTLSSGPSGVGYDAAIATSVAAAPGDDNWG